MHTILNQQQLDASINGFISRKLEKFPELNDISSKTKQQILNNDTGRQNIKDFEGANSYNFFQNLGISSFIAKSV